MFVPSFYKILIGYIYYDYINTGLNLTKINDHLLNISRIIFLS